MFNLLKTAILMAAITALFMAIGALLGGRSGMVFALAIAIAMNFFSYWFSDKLVLRMYNAHEVDEASAPQFYRIVRELAQKAGLPMPRVYPIDGLLVMLLAPIAASLIQMAISRAREFEADRGGAELSGDPQALASALQKIQRYAQGIPLPTAERHPETAQMMIMNPLHGGGLRNLFSTHPSTEERVERLLAMVVR